MECPGLAVSALLTDMLAVIYAATPSFDLWTQKRTSDGLIESRLRTMYLRIFEQLLRLDSGLQDLHHQLTIFEKDFERKACVRENTEYMVIVQERIFFWTSKLTSHNPGPRLQQGCPRRIRDSLSIKISQSPDLHETQFKPKLSSPTSGCSPNRAEPVPDVSSTERVFNRKETESEFRNDLRGSDNDVELIRSLKRRRTASPSPLIAGVASKVVGSHGETYTRCHFQDCDTKFSGELDTRLGNLRRHIKTTHSDSKHCCEACGVCYNRRDNLLAHSRKGCRCAECNQSFQSLDLHAKMTNHKAFKCIHADCGSTFARRDAFTRHEATHKDEAAYSCPFCDRSGKKGFKRKDHLLQHLSSRHKEEQYPKFCEHADCRSKDAVASRVEFTSVKAYRNHMRDVHDQTPFQCDWPDCDRKGKKGYTREGDLELHKQSHQQAITPLNSTLGNKPNAIEDLHHGVAMIQDVVPNSELLRSTDSFLSSIGLETPTKKQHEEIDQVQESHCSENVYLNWDDFDLNDLNVDFFEPLQADLPLCDF